MRTGVVNGVELAIHVEQGELLSLHLDQLAVARFDLVRLRHFDIIGHVSLLESLNFPAARCPVRIGEDPRRPHYPGCRAAKYRLARRVATYPAARQPG